MPNPNHVILDDIVWNEVLQNEPLPEIRIDPAMMERVRREFINANPAPGGIPIPRRVIPKAKQKPKFQLHWGGRDVDPGLYNRPMSLKCGQPNAREDQREMDAMLKAIEQGIPVIGICRGAQLLNVANGGILIQHIEDHTRSHSVHCDYRDWNRDVRKEGIFDKVSSTHHQAMIPTTEGKILGRSFESVQGVHWDNVDQGYIYPHVNEVIYYPKTKSLCIQPHPEWMNQQHPFVEWLNFVIFHEFDIEPLNFADLENNQVGWNYDDMRKGEF